MKRLLFCLTILLPAALSAQQTLSLDECRQMAVSRNKELDQQRLKLEMAGYDRKIAASNYFPKISAIGTYQHVGGDFSLVHEESIPSFSGLGTAAQTAYNERLTEIMQAAMSDPAIASRIASSPALQQIVGKLSTLDLATSLDMIGGQVDKSIHDMTHPDISNIYVGALSLQQPVFVGGKIIAANRMAKYAEDLARFEYDGNYDGILVAVDQAYWQVVSVAQKKKLAESYSKLLDHMLGNVEKSVLAGVATEADALTVKVKRNEAAMTATKAANGLVLARMMLCKQVGLPLDSDIRLADEDLEIVPAPAAEPEKSMEDIYASRSETRRLDLAAKVYDEKVKIARADMMPQVALTANYVWMNPNMNDGFRNSFGSHWAAGVMVKIPIFHGMEALNRTRKAKAEAEIYRSRLDDAQEMISLQVTQLRQQSREAEQRLEMAQSNLASAEENLRTANVGFEAGVVDMNTTLGAQTAWLQAHSEYIDAGIELQINNSKLKQAQGSYTSDIELARQEKEKNK